MALTDEHISEIEAPTFVSDEDAREYAEQGYLDFEAGPGWYIEAVAQVSESEYGEFWVGSQVRRYFGPYESEQEAKLFIASQTATLVVL